MAAARLSLVAEFDDLLRSHAVLSSPIEQDFAKFVMNQELCRQQWLEAEKTCIEQSKRAKELEHDNQALKTKLKHARGQIEHEMTKRQRLEQERDALERQISVVRELLNDKNRTALDEKDRERLAFLSTDFINSQFLSPKCNYLETIDESRSILSPSDISYDRTEEDLDSSRAYATRSTKRPSAPPGDEENESMPSGKRVRRAAQQKKKHRRSKSADMAPLAEPEMEMSPLEPEPRQRRFSTPGPLKVLSAVDSIGNLRDVDENGVGLNSVGRKNGFPFADSAGMKRFGSGNSLSKLHSFISKNFYKQDSCAACGKKPRFGSKVAKCKECRLVAHQECKDLLPLPCIPSAVTPAKNTACVGYLGDYVSSEPPMIPAIVIRCVEEVNCRGIKEEGIYRISGSDKDVKELKEKFLKGKTLPNLSLVSDIHVICGCLKDFLRSLKEPVVTFRLWNSFATAVEKLDDQDNDSDLYQAISELPPPNRDTLAYIILHLQKISGIPACKMPAENLATVFGPTVVGYSCAEPTMNQIMAQTKTQQMIIKRLMAIPGEYWSAYTKVEPDFDIQVRDSSTPNVNYRHLPRYNCPQSAPATAPSSSLGLSNGQRDTPFGKKGQLTSKKTRQFFETPSLK